MNLARVFPRKTKQSPDDAKAFFGFPDIKTTPYFDAVDISVAFTYDIPKAEQMAERWRHHTASVRMGGPAFGRPSVGEFEPGKYVKKGITFTSRGCPNKCWFCSVWKRETDGLRELAIKDGWVVGDDNLLACSDGHIKSVFSMLHRQPQRPRFLGGLEARLLKDWHCEAMKTVKTEVMYFAYDTKDDLDPLRAAGELLPNYGFNWSSKKLMCYVLMGYKGDTIDAAHKRIENTVRAGFWPLAMLWRGDKEEKEKTWLDFSRYWARPPLYFREAQRIYWLQGLI
jgi:hypothetical protein